MIPTIAIFLILFVVPGQEQPAIYTEEMTVEECMKATNEFVQQVFASPHEGRYQVGCMFEMPALKDG